MIRAIAPFYSREDLIAQTKEDIAQICALLA